MSLKLINLKEDDLEIIMKWRMSPEVSQYMYTEPQLTLESQYKWFHDIKNDNKVKYWIIQFEKDKIGLINLYNIDHNNKRSHWAYYLGDTSVRGKGIGTLLECNIYDHVFYKLHMNKLCCEVFVFNEKVIQIHQKFGSEVEGVFRQHISKKGQYYDIVTMAILKEKWDQTKTNFAYDKIYIEE